jgi:hypothetical protein
MVAGGKQFSGGQQFDSAVVEDNNFTVKDFHS